MSEVLIRLGDALLRWAEGVGSCAPLPPPPSTALPVWDLVHQGDVVDDEGLSSQLWGTIHSGKFEQGHQQHQTLPLEPRGRTHFHQESWYLEREGKKGNLMSPPRSQGHAPTHVICRWRRAHEEERFSQRGAGRLSPMGYTALTIEGQLSSAPFSVSSLCIHSNKRPGPC